jgi:hypothetical protein
MTVAMLPIARGMITRKITLPRFFVPTLWKAEKRKEERALCALMAHRAWLN